MAGDWNLFLASVAEQEKLNAIKKHERTDRPRSRRRWRPFCRSRESKTEEHVDDVTRPSAENLSRYGGTSGISQPLGFPGKRIGVDIAKKRPSNKGG